MGGLTIHVAHVTIYFLLFQTDACKLNLKKPFSIDEGDQQVSSKEKKMISVLGLTLTKKRHIKVSLFFILVVSCLLFIVNFYKSFFKLFLLFLICFFCPI
jgi:hypothetical protein